MVKLGTCLASDPILRANLEDARLLAGQAINSEYSWLETEKSWLCKICSRISSWRKMCEQTYQTWGSKEGLSVRLQTIHKILEDYAMCFAKPQALDVHSTVLQPLQE